MDSVRRLVFSGLLATGTACDSGVTYEDYVDDSNPLERRVDQTELSPSTYVRELSAFEEQNPYAGGLADLYAQGGPDAFWVEMRSAETRYQVARFFEKNPPNSRSIDIRNADTMIKAYREAADIVRAIDRSLYDDPISPKLVTMDRIEQNYIKACRHSVMEAPPSTEFNSGWAHFVALANLYAHVQEYPSSAGLAKIYREGGFGLGLHELEDEIENMDASSTVNGARSAAFSVYREISNLHKTVDAYHDSPWVWNDFRNSYYDKLSFQIKANRDIFLAAQGLKIDPERDWHCYRSELKSGPPIGLAVYGDPEEGTFYKSWPFNTPSPLETYVVEQN